MACCATTADAERSASKDWDLMMKFGEGNCPRWCPNAEVIVFKELSQIEEYRKRGPALRKKMAEKERRKAVS